MKNLIILTLSISLFGGVFTACKKGENDPFIYMKSRKARLAGEWKMVSSEDVITFTGTDSEYSYVETSTEAYDGTTLTTTTQLKVTSSAGTVEDSQTKTKKYTESFTFEKDGTYTKTHFDTESGLSTKEEGYWSFMSKNKAAGIKKKEAIALTATKTTNSDGSIGSTNDEPDYADIFVIDQLKSNEIVFKYDLTMSDPDYNGTKKGTITLEAK
jgi:hypothetical protein